MIVTERAPAPRLRAGGKTAGGFGVQRHDDRRLRGGPPAALHPRARSGGGGLDRGRGPGRLGRTGPPRRTPRVHAVVGGRASQHGRYRELRAGGADRASGCVDDDHPRRCRWRDAPESRRARGGRAVRNARGVAPGPDRPRARTRAGDGPGHRGGPAPEPHAVRRGGVSRATTRPVPLLRRHAPADHRGPRRAGIDPRSGCSVPVATARRLQAHSGSRSRSRIISRRTTPWPRSSCTDRRSGRRRSSTTRTR